MFQYNLAVVLDTEDKWSTHRKKKMIEYVSNQRKIDIIKRKNCQEPSHSCTPRFPPKGITNCSIIYYKQEKGLKKKKEICH